MVENNEGLKKDICQMLEIIVERNVPAGGEEGQALDPVLLLFTPPEGPELTGKQIRLR